MYGQTKRLFASSLASGGATDGARPPPQGNDTTDCLTATFCYFCAVCRLGTERWSQEEGPKHQARRADVLTCRPARTERRVQVMKFVDANAMDLNTKGVAAGEPVGDDE